MDCHVLSSAPTYIPSLLSPVPTSASKQVASPTLLRFSRILAWILQFPRKHDPSENISGSNIRLLSLSGHGRFFCPRLLMRRWAAEFKEDGNIVVQPVGQQ